MNVFTFVSDVNKSGAKSKPLQMTAEEIDDEIAMSYDTMLGDGQAPNYHEQFTGSCIPYIDLDVLGETDTEFYINKVKSAVAAVFGECRLILADRSGFSVKHQKNKVSIRAYIRNAGYFTSPLACGAFMTEAFKELGIDADAYKSRQNMGLVYNTKMGDNRILELLDQGKRVSYTNQSIKDTIIQNIDGETVCIDPENVQQAVAYVETEGDETIDRVLAAAKSLMPGLEIRKVLEKEDSQIVEFIKTRDECPICKRMHTGNRAYAVVYAEKAYLKCHDQDSKNKKIELFNDENKQFLIEESESDEEEAEVPAEIEDTPSLALLRGSHTDEDYAEYFIAKYPNQFILFDGALYHFKEHIWNYCNNDKILYNFLGNKLYRDLRRVLDATYTDIAEADQHAIISKHLLILRSWNKRSGIVSSIKAKIEVRSDIFDLDPNLMGFANGVYDLNSGFRDGKYDDYVSKATDYDYDDVSNESKEKLMSFINKIMPVEDERDCLLRGLSSGLYGKTLQNMFILTGSGGNGKDSLVSKLYRDTIGRDLYEYSNTAILTEKRKGDLCQGIANMNKKRAVVWSEPAKQSVLQGSVIKEITGVDQINARGLYSTNTCTRIMASTFLLCNDIPKVDAVDGGLARRLIVIPFRSLFKTSDEIERMVNAEHVYEADGFYDSSEFRQEFKLTFFHILLDHFQEFKAHGYMMKSIPQSIKDLSQQYLADSDDFLSWYANEYEKAENEFVQLKDVWVEFKMSDLYMNLTKSEKRTMNKKKMVENVRSTPALNCYYKDTHQPRINGKTKCYRSVLIGYRKRIEEVESDSEDEE
jgi:phage/plasmid-associated DNA primase